MFHRVFVLLIVAAALLRSLAAAEDIGIRAPEGFEVSLYADDNLAHDIYSMTIDAKGRVVVAGQGYVKVLHDEDNDGRADRVTLFSEFPKSGAHGMVFLGNDLIATGDNLLMKLEDKDGDGAADGRPIPLANVKSPEHGANGLVQGPDGWIYMICGNDAGVGSQLARTKTSPVKKPNAGAVVRFSPDFKTSEIFAHGFRNPYDLAFNQYGQLFTVDADGERDQHLPWYTPTRLFDIQQGGHHGWVQSGWTRSWNRPESFFDNVPRLVEIGRGSPTGVECYRHYTFPQHWRGGIYSCCWTLGTVYYFPLARDGASYKSRKEIFLQTTGDVGFAPVDLAVGPDGDMFVAIGGRGTRGSVFRVRYVGELKDDELAPKLKTDVEKVVAAPQPLAAWSRAKWMPLAKALGREKLEQAAMDSKLTSSTGSIRAIEAVTELHGGISNPTLLALAGFNTIAPIRSTDDRQIIARALWSAARSEEREDAVNDLGMVNFSRGAVVSRSTWEWLASPDPQSFKYEPSFRFRDSAHAQRREQLASLQLPLEHAEKLKGHFDGHDTLDLSTLLRHRALHGDLEAGDFTHCLDLFSRARERSDLAGRLATVEETVVELHRLRRMLTRDAIRMMQLCLGDIRITPMRPDVYAGYTANAAEKVPEKLRRKAAAKMAAAFPTDDDEANREIARTIGMLDVSGPHEAELVKKLTAQFFNVKSTVKDDIHYLIVLSRLGGERSEEATGKTAAALAFLHYKMMLGEMYPSRNWPLRVGEVFVELCQRDPKLAEALATHRDFGLPQHAMFAELMPENERKLAARRMLAKAQQLDEEDARWTPEMVKLIAELGDEEALAAVRGQWRDYSLRDAIVASLYKIPQAIDQKLYFEALDSPQPETVTRAAEALTQLNLAGSAQDIATALAALRFYSQLEEQGDTRKALAGALQTLSDDLFAPDVADSPTKAYEQWLKWFTEKYPDEAKKFQSGDTAADFSAQLDRVDWTAGDARRGAKVYEKQSCAKCHSGTNRLGPGLEGVTGRWSQADLFREIVDPNRNVAPQFQIMRLITREGKVYQGMPVYESPDGTLLQSGPDETIRIAGTEVVSAAKSRNSLMPTGLLRGLSDEDMADLYAYMKTLTTKRE